MNDAIMSVVTRLVDAWDTRSVTEWVSLFAPDAVYITGDGRHLQGHAQLAGLIPTPDARDDRIMIADAAIHTHEPSAAHVVCRWYTSDRAGWITCVLTYDTHGWRVQHLHNTSAASSA